MKKSRLAAVVGAIAATAFTLALTACSGDGTTSHHDQVAARGATVMPFDLSKTHHVFEANSTGGVETVKVLDNKDTTQIGLVRSHLQVEAQKFAAGDFSDPMAIHGMTMPGTAALATAGTRLRIEYAELPDGAKITYSSDDPVVVAAIHDWFNAQLSDHGHDASTH